MNSDNDEIRDLIAELTRKQLASQIELDMLISNTNSVLGRSAVIDSMILEVRENTELMQRNLEQQQRNFERHQENFDRHQENFHENQRTTNAALQSLEAILLQLTRNNN